MLSDQQVEGILDAFALALSIDKDFQEFSLAACASAPKETDSPDLKRRHAAAMLPHLIELQRKLAMGSLRLRQAIGPAFPAAN